MADGVLRLSFFGDGAEADDVRACGGGPECLRGGAAYERDEVICYGKSHYRIRYCEIHLKGNNRGYFEKVFQENLERALRGIRHEIRRPSGRYIVEGFR